MTNYERIAEAYNDRRVVSACRNIRPHDWQDIRSDVAEKLLNMTDAQLTSIRDMGGFMAMCCRNACLDIQRASQRRIMIELPADIADITDGYERLNAKIQSDMDSPKRFYHARIFIYSLAEQNMLAFSRKIGIPYGEIRRTIQEYTEYLKEWVKR